MIPRRVAVAAGFAALMHLAGAAAGRGQGIAVEGSDSARMLAPQGAVVEPYANRGYSLAIVDGEVRVQTDAEPLRSHAPYVPPRADAALDADPLHRLARSLVSGAGTRYDAVTRVLGWVSREIRYELDRAAPQAAADVLARRSGYCTGVARLSVALLAAAGIESREVAGWVIGDAAAGSAATYHRWIEVWYPDRGWVFSDPLVSHNWVPANYLRLGSDRVDVEGMSGGLLLERRDGVKAVDTYPAGAAPVRARRNEAHQLAGSLRVEVDGRAAGTATLEGEGYRRSSDLLAGSGTFVGLAPGDYALRVELPGGPVLERRVRMRARVKSAIFFSPVASASPGEGQSR